VFTGFKVRAVADVTELLRKARLEELQGVCVCVCVERGVWALLGLWRG
jgi:hypothetical protein